MNQFEQPIYLPVAPSRHLLYWSLVAHAALAAIVCPLADDVPVAAGVALLLLGHAAWWWRTRGQAHAEGIVALLLTSDGNWRVTLRDGRVLVAHLAARPLVSVSLTAVSLRVEQLGLRHLLITPDAVPTDPYRRLRVRLRFAAASQGRSRTTR